MFLNKFVAVAVVVAISAVLTPVLCVGSQPPAIEGCPSDSIQIEEICKCNLESCEKPPCLSTLNILSNGTDEPGNCCPKFSCDGCEENSKIDGQCPCALDAVLNEKNICECIDKEKHLINNECVCNPSLCELPQLCNKTSVAVTVEGGCCPKTKCIPCPSDSYPSNRGADPLEELCVCYPCKKECGVNQTVIIKKYGKNLPGSCCDLYECKTVQLPNSFCKYDDKTYLHGDHWSTSDQVCKCQEGLALCSPLDKVPPLNCHKEQKFYKDKESWTEDNCTNCTCYNGKIKCISYFCDLKETQVKKNDCQPLNCNRSCPIGYRVNKRGCEICKCVIPKVSPELLHYYNLNSTEDLLRVLDAIKDKKIDEDANVTVVNTGVPIWPSTNINIIFYIVTVVGVMLFLGGVWWCWRKKNRNRKYKTVNNNNINCTENRDKLIGVTHY